MTRAPRRKRASPADLYRTCATGDCPPDVKNIYEHKTVADKILQYGSLGVFFGRLGIGTGSGGGGALGYRPIGPSPTTRLVGSGVPARPPLLVDALGPIAYEDAGLFDSAVVALTDSSAGVDIGPAVEVIELQPLAPTSEGPAVLDVTTETAPGAPRTTRSYHQNPVFQASWHTPSSVGETSDQQAVSVLGDSHVSSAASESIELVKFGPRFSTPNAAPRAMFRPPRVSQTVQTSDPDFLVAPSRLTQFTYDNPAFDGSGSFEFGTDAVDVPAAAPDVGFNDLVRLGRQQLYEGPGGHVRAGRVGQRGTLRTRTGTVVGPQVFIFQELSSIANVSGEVFGPGELSGEAVHSLGSLSDFEVISLGSTSSYSDSALLDSESLDFTGHLVFSYSGGSARRPEYVHVHIPGLGAWIPENSVWVVNPGSAEGGLFPSSTSAGPSTANSLDASYSYYLHPSLNNKKKKKSKGLRGGWWFVADDLLAT
ncbi:L2 [Equus caballus papillomavirus 8]|uniref:Minor capsid protein L2 n=1 Tax=Equus caballus papillomavirus 8 TaxID=1912759 RepID=A0A1D9EQ30_9PAPI|nr:L2 [Equus caballus papillomavirus 8]AOY65118.1 L2 [Equus caballus papillomavirus 8]